MAPAAPSNHDPALTAQATPAQGQTQQGQPDLPGVQIGGLNHAQIMTLLRHLPGVFNKLAEAGNLDSESTHAAQTLSNLSQAPAYPHLQYPPGQVPQQPGNPNVPQANQQQQSPVPGMGVGVSEPGPSSHPRGPPNLGQLSAAALQTSSPMSATRTQGQNMPGVAMPVGGMPVSVVTQIPGQPMQAGQGQDIDDGSESDDKKRSGTVESPTNNPTPTSAPTTGGRARRSATMGSEEWARQRKDNHKEVERRRRGNINEGINELGRIVPNGNGEKAKGAILARACQYIHHLKENEARNIEKWSLEKLLMDQAMGDLQGQLGEMQNQFGEAQKELGEVRGQLVETSGRAEESRRMWEEERVRREKLEKELEELKKSVGKESEVAMVAGIKRRGEEKEGDEGKEPDGKKQKVQ